MPAKKKGKIPKAKSQILRIPNTLPFTIRNREYSSSFGVHPDPRLSGTTRLVSRNRIKMQALPDLFIIMAGSTGKTRRIRQGIGFSRDYLLIKFIF
jgi:hypothetical protein